MRDLSQSTAPLSLPHAVAFYQKDYEAKRTLASNFGRIATLPDVIHARLQSAPDSPAWQFGITTDTNCWFGTDTAGTRWMIVVHGNGPSVEQEYHTSPTRKMFVSLLNGEFGPIQAIDLTTYTPSNELLTPKEVLEHPVLPIIIGDDAATFLAVHAEYTNNLRTPEAQATAVQHTISIKNFVDYHVAAFIQRSKNDPTYVCAYHVSTWTYLDSGTTYLSFNTTEQCYVVGIQGDKAPTQIVKDFSNIAADIHKHWRHFVQPLAEVPKDPFPGIMADGSQQKPYYVIKTFHCGAAVGRVNEKGFSAQLPEFRIIERKDILRQKVQFRKAGTPHDFVSTAYPYAKLWHAAHNLLPQGANAMSFYESEFNYKGAFTSVCYSHIAVERFYFLMQWGDTLFSQYPETVGPEPNIESGMPYRPVSQVRHIKDVDIYPTSDEQSDLSMSNCWRRHILIMTRAPKNANAVLIPKNQPLNLDGRPNCMSVKYYRVTAFEPVAFRSLWEISADIHWLIERRNAAGLLP